GPAMKLVGSYVALLSHAIVWGMACSSWHKSSNHAAHAMQVIGDGPVQLPKPLKGHHETSKRVALSKPLAP
ncbi:MAG: hypothetical protein NUW23_10665, partial [Firmicutes bacterium]|nr:hypothetical protein [Bacillota bacterium]